jgi:integrase/recombinase XerD
MTSHLNGQAVEKSSPLTRSPLAKSVSGTHAWDNGKVSLHATNGERKYLNQDERRRALRAMRRLEPSRSLYAQLLAWTGARPSEILNLSANSFDIEAGTVNIVTLKQRSHAVRGVPVPPGLMAALVRHFDLRRLQQEASTGSLRLFPWSRITAWRIIKQVMAWAAISGIKACPKGFRHAFGVCALQSGVPLTLVQRWMGHARLSTTAIYLNVSGPDELIFARWFWNGTRRRPGPPTAFRYAMAA